MGASSADPCGLEPPIVIKSESFVFSLYFSLFLCFIESLVEGLSQESVNQGNKEYRRSCKRSTASTLRSTVTTVDRYSSAVDRRNGRPMLLSGRPSPTEDEWWPDVWSSEAVRNAKGDCGKASKR